MKLRVPCLHRVHVGEPRGAVAVHNSLGMSIEYQSLIRRLEQLDQEAQRSGCLHSMLVSFDDGWADVVLLAPHFAQWPYLQPVLFLTSAQLFGERSLLPLPRLYDWCASSGTEVDALSTYGITRSQLKLISEEAQHLELDRIAVPRVAQSSEMLTENQIRNLIAQGWLVGSHGYEHYDLRQADPADLECGLDKALRAVVQFGGVRWLAWPEGRCCARTCDVAAFVGFELQFSLDVESGSLDRLDLIHREIWK